MHQVLSGELASVRDRAWYAMFGKPRSPCNVVGYFLPLYAGSIPSRISRERSERWMERTRCLAAAHWRSRASTAGWSGGALHVLSQRFARSSRHQRNPSGVGPQFAHAKRDLDNDVLDVDRLQCVLDTRLCWFRQCVDLRRSSDRRRGGLDDFIVSPRWTRTKHARVSQPHSFGHLDAQCLDRDQAIRRWAMDRRLSNRGPARSGPNR